MHTRNLWYPEINFTAVNFSVEVVNTQISITKYVFLVHCVAKYVKNCCANWWIPYSRKALYKFPFLIETNFISCLILVQQSNIFTFFLPKSEHCFSTYSFSHFDLKFIDIHCFQCFFCCVLFYCYIYFVFLFFFVCSKQHLTSVIYLNCVCI